MVTTRGSWTLHEAIVRRWEDAELDASFRDHWPVPTETRYNPLHDGEARATPPGPYCVYEIDEGSIDSHNSGTHGEQENQFISIPVTFNIHAKSTSSKSGKRIAKDLAKEVAAAFDPGRLFGALRIEDDAHFQTFRGTDFSVREGDTEWMWVLQYTIVIDATYYTPKFA